MLLNSYATVKSQLIRYKPCKGFSVGELVKGIKGGGGGGILFLIHVHQRIRISRRAYEQVWGGYN